MFESISWREFISTMVITGSGYYVITALLLYRSEIAGIFKQKKLNLTHTGQRVKQTDSDELTALMGVVKYATRQSESVPREEKVGAEGLSVVPPLEPEEPVKETIAGKTDEGVLTSASNLLDDINTLTQAVASGSKKECAELFRTLLSNYADLVHTAHEPEITAFIYNSCNRHCEFQIELSEVKSWWPNPGTAAINNQSPSNKN